ncbi:MAG TPA: polysaccharide pyruvyl transferase family protein [Acidimicrobiales bacterium]|nr:polysaccharide pyruvyl transferase family protein [Acidimicrobiales bacterium]
MIGLIHAYSRTNAGDGLLVDLALERLRRVGITPDDVLVVALDPDSFPELPHRAAIGARGRGLAWELVPAAGRAAAVELAALPPRVPVGGLARALRGCDGFVAVGGGYLRAVDATSSLGTLLNHLPQLAYAGRSAAPSVYLPQSIGPLNGPVGGAVKRALGRIDAVCVRDGWSVDELQGLSNVRRLADLAVLDVAERWDDITPAGTTGQVGFVARRVDHAAGYEGVVRALADELAPDSVWAVQTAGDRTKSDAVHYERLGVASGGGLADLLARPGELSAVVSVRLHGALMSIEAGVPAVHLAYDRKGPAAFADLGLDDWCFDVRRLDADALRAAVEGLRTDPGPYWERLAKQVPTLRTQSSQLDDLVASTLT